MTAADQLPAPAALEPVTDGVYAFIQPDGGWCLSNAGVVAGDGTSVLIDTAATRARAARLRDAVAAVTGGVPPLLVNTHHHGDHVFGNALFAPPATIIAHEQARPEMAAAGLGLQQLWPDVDWGGLPLRLPAVTFREALTIWVDDRRLELRHVGPAHTTNDVVAWLPDQRVLFAGDVAMAGATPFCLMGSVAGSLQAVAALQALEPLIVVPGHGPVSGPEILEETAGYLRWVQQQARRGRRDGRSPLAAARAADLGSFAALLDAERLVGNLSRAYAELDGAPPGAPLDVISAMREMTEYHGGALPCHA